MNSKLLIFIFFTLISAGAAFGQTKSDIESKFGKPVNVYPVSEPIWMTPQYTAGGEICRMSFYPKRISATTNYLGDSLEPGELKALINQFAPTAGRGAKALLYGLTQFGGHRGTTFYSYQKVIIQFHFSVLGPIEIKAPEPDEVVKKTPSGEINVPKYVQIATIAWRDRACAKD